jgi:hypothetical protein
MHGLLTIVELIGCGYLPWHRKNLINILNVSCA